LSNCSAVNSSFNIASTAAVFSTAFGSVFKRSVSLSVLVGDDVFGLVLSAGGRLIVAGIDDFVSCFCSTTMAGFGASTLAGSLLSDDSGLTLIFFLTLPEKQESHFDGHLIHARHAPFS
jgi:hypothetical protein